ncbi:unnamed protein product [Allacma fusca]|uniref:Tudor domain-containing protein n=1 Tax=Allacma fusca TaxID=39272 RepID=A0A8J2MB16_9HEXA|nr:unnamed protein product [Allacma fusca]
MLQRLQSSSKSQSLYLHLWEGFAHANIKGLEIQGKQFVKLFPNQKLQSKSLRMSVRRPRPAQNNKASSASHRQVGKSSMTSLCGIPPLIPDNDTFHSYGTKDPQGLKVSQQNYRGRVAPEKVHPFQISQYSVSTMGSGNYFGPGKAGFGRPHPVDNNYSSSADTVNQVFRKLECSCCSYHIGFQHRTHREIVACSPSCLSRVSVQSQQIPVVASNPFRDGTAGSANLPQRNQTGKAHDCGKSVTKILRTEVFNSMPKNGGNQGRDNKNESNPESKNGESNGRTAVSSQKTNNHLAPVESTSSEDTFKQTSSKPYRGDSRVTSKRGGRGRFRGSFHGHGESLYTDSSFYEPQVEPIASECVKEESSLMSNFETQDKPPAAKPLFKQGKKLTCTSTSSVTNSSDRRSAGQSKEVVSQSVKLQRGWKFSDLKLSKKLRDNAECFVVYVGNVNKIVLQAVEDEENVKKLKECIHEYCLKETPMSKDRSPFLDDIIFAKTGVDENYYRGKVKNIDMKKGGVEVDFFEDGGVFPVHLSHCWEPCDEIMKNHPIYGIKFTVSPFDHSFNHTCATLAQNKAEENNNFIIQRAKKTQREWIGEILSIKSNKTWNEIMRKAPISKIPASQDARNSCEADHQTNAAAEIENSIVSHGPESKTTSSQAENVELSKEVEDVRSIGLAEAPPISETKAVTKVGNPFVTQDSKSESSYLKKETAEIKLESMCADERHHSRSSIRYTAEDMERSKTLENGSKVRVRFVWNNSKLTISTVDDDKAMEDLDDAISRYVSEAEPMNRDPVFDEVVLAPYQDVYYRGKVLALTENKVHVEFIDYGDQDHVDKSQLKEINEEIGQHPIYGWTVLMLGIPEGAPQVESEELDLIDTEVEMQLKLESQNNGICTGLLYLAHDRTWTDIILDAIEASVVKRGARSSVDCFKDMVPKRRFNPWTLEILEILGLEASTSDVFSVGRCKSLLDQRLLERFGENYLVALAQRCFRTHLKKVKDFQCASILKQNPRNEPIFSDLSKKFYYDGADVPRVQIPVRTKIHIRLTAFDDIHSWQVLDFLPKKEQLCLVCVPSWAMIDRYMEQDKGHDWNRKVHRRTNWEEEDGWQANNWFRGVMIGPCNRFSQASHCFEFWLPDVCRFVPVPRDKIIPAVYRFTTIPALGIFGCLLPYNDWIITPEERRQKWYALLHKGTVFPCIVVGHARIKAQVTTIVRMPVDIEEKFSELERRDPSLMQNSRKLDPRVATLNENEVACTVFN